MAAKPYSELSPREVDRLIIKCRRAMHSHYRDSLQSNPDRAEEALAALQSVRQMLGELLQVVPEAKRGKIENALRNGQDGEAGRAIEDDKKNPAEAGSSY